MCLLLTELERHVHAMHQRLGYSEQELASMCYDMAEHLEPWALPEQCLRLFKGDPIDDESPI